MTNTIRRLLAHRVRHLAVLASVLAAAAATAVSLAARSPHQPGPAASQHSTGVPSARADLPLWTSTAPRPSTSSTPSHPTSVPSTAARTEPARRIATSTPTPAATTAESAKEQEDLLKRQDPVPDDIAEQVEFFFGGGRENECTRDQRRGPPYITGADLVVEVPTALMLCFYNFDLTVPLTVTIAGPSRPATTVVLPPSENFFSTGFRGIPTDPLGIYRVNAEQDKPSLDASFEFTLQHATSPRLWLDQPAETWTAAGNDVHLYLGGHPPNGSTPLHLYDANTGHYRTSFTVAVDATGEAHVVIDTKPDDPPGCYGVISPLAHKPGAIEASAFCIR